MRRFLTYVLMCAALVQHCAAQDADTLGEASDNAGEAADTSRVGTTGERADATGDPTSSTRWAVVPIFFSSPDTRLGIGAVPHVVFYTGLNARRSTAKLEASYTQNHQFNFRVSTTLWLPSNEYGAEARAQYQYWPSSFYGIGNNTSDDLKEKYSSRVLTSTIEVQNEVAEHVYAGGRLDIRNDDVVEAAEGGLLDRRDILGSDGGMSVGLGVSAAYDSRDETVYPTEGKMLRAGTRLFLRAFGSDFNYARHRFEARSYVDLEKKRVIAGQFVAAFASGEPPFQMYSTVGELLRAYSSSRYIDKHMLAARLEYRHTPVIWRFGYAAFVGAGQVAHSLGGFDVGSVHLSAGAGLRFLLLKSEQVVLRWDFAVGTHTTGTYLDIGEAF